MNITVIDATRTLLTFGQIGLKLALIVRLLGLASCLVGLLIMISALVATRQERIRQSVYYRILGASKSFVQRVFLTESILIGSTAAVCAMLLAQTVAWLVCRQALSIPYGPYGGNTLLLGSLILGSATVAVAASGASGSGRPNAHADNSLSLPE